MEKFDPKKFSIKNVKNIESLVKVPVRVIEEKIEPIVQFRENGRAMKIYKNLGAVVDVLAREEFKARNIVDVDMQKKVAQNIRCAINSAAKGRTIKKDGTKSYFARGFRWRYFEDVRKDK